MTTMITNNKPIIKELKVENILGNEIEDTPSFGVSVNTDFILGMGKAHGKVTILLDIAKVLTKDDVASIYRLAL